MKEFGASKKRNPCLLRNIRNCDLPIEGNRIDVTFGRSWRNRQIDWGLSKNLTYFTINRVCWESLWRQENRRSAEAKVHLKLIKHNDRLMRDKQDRGRMIEDWRIVRGKSRTRCKLTKSAIWSSRGTIGILFVPSTEADTQPVLGSATISLQGRDILFIRSLAGEKIGNTWKISHFHGYSRIVRESMVTRRSAKGSRVSITRNVCFIRNKQNCGWSIEQKRLSDWRTSAPFVNSITSIGLLLENRERATRLNWLSERWLNRVRDLRKTIRVNSKGYIREQVINLHKFML